MWRAPMRGRQETECSATQAQPLKQIHVKLDAARRKHGNPLDTENIAAKKKKNTARHSSFRECQLAASLQRVGQIFLHLLLVASKALARGKADVIHLKIPQGSSSFSEYAAGKEEEAKTKGADRGSMEEAASQPIPC